MGGGNMSRCGPESQALVAVLAALGLRAAGAPVGVASLRRALGALGVAEPDRWVLDCVVRLVGEDTPATSPTGGELVSRVQGLAAGADEGPGEALYLYAIGRGGVELPEGCTGVDGRPVKVVRAGEWFALVHECAAVPYASQDRDVVERWLTQHQSVLEQVMPACADLIPVAFDTLIGPDGQGAGAPYPGNPARALERWMDAHSAQLAEILGRIAGCREYGVQLLCETEPARRAILGRSADLQSLSRRIEQSPPAAAYLLRRELEQRLAEELQAQGRRRVSELESILRAACRDLRVERPREMGDGVEMVGNFSCLVPAGQVDDLLSRLNAWNSDGYRLRVTGPWPPYSFVNLSPGGSASP